MHDMLQGVLSRHEKDFLSAYKAHMSRVREELITLRDKAEKADQKNKSDQKLNTLENQLEWFREEAVRLGDVCNNQQKEIEKWRAKAEALEEDRKFLEQQIKAAKRQNKLLKTALGRTDDREQIDTHSTDVRKELHSTLGKLTNAQMRETVREWLNEDDAELG
jgi:TPP-dependent indolepyruvate ferredoxin oxidoreductase alpha subunit